MQKITQEIPYQFPVNLDELLPKDRLICHIQKFRSDLIEGGLLFLDDKGREVLEDPGGMGVIPLREWIILRKTYLDASNAKATKSS